jgi:3-oxoacyl-[acyl-carrier protein] reductase
VNKKDLEKNAKISTVLINGGLSHLGRCLISKFLESNSNILFTARDQEKIDFYEKDFKQSGNLKGLKVSSYSYSDYRKLIGSMNTLGIFPNTIINCVGLSRGYNGELFDLRKSFEVNLASAVELVEAFQEEPDSNPYLRMILIGSIASRNGQADLNYSITKAALDAYIKFKARELAKQNSKINLIGVSLGPINFIGKGMNKFSLADPGGFISYLEANRIYLKRAADPAEIAEILNFLTFSAPNYMSGSILELFGGGG